MTVTGGATGAGAGSTGAAAVSTTDSAAGAAAFLAGAFAAGASAASALAGSASLMRRTTGGSSVEDADFTNSPSSWALARTSLLVYPSSLASSWTRTFDTTLLSWSGRGAPDRQCKRYTFMLACSWGVHPRTPDPLGLVRRPRLRAPDPADCLAAVCTDRVPQEGQVQWTGHPQGPGKCPLPLSAVEALLGRMEVCSPARQPSVGIRDAGPGDDDHP